MLRKTILISGAGIAGPTLAYWLLRAGFTPVLVERAPEFREGGYIIDFWGVGFDVAERMGLIPELRETGYMIDRMEFLSAGGKTRSAIGGNVLRRALGDRFLSIQRGDLARAIYHTVEREMETTFGDGITEIRDVEDGVEVNFERSPSRVFDLVVGADGLHSAVRGLLPMAHEPAEQYMGYYSASFLTSGYERRTEHTYLSYAAPGRQISRYALRGNRTAFFFVFESANKIPKTVRDVTAQKQILQEKFSVKPWREWPEIESRLETCEDLYFDSVSQITLPTWSQGRIALTGDAAYCPSLLAGEGSAFAMAGAYILARELAHSGGDHIRAFAAYESRFRPFIERKQKSARAFASSFAPKTSFGLFVRDQVLQLSSIPFVGDLLMRSFVSDSLALPD